MGQEFMGVDFVSSTGPIQPSEDPTAEYRSETLAPGLDKAFVISATNTLQVLVCLRSLMRAHAVDSAKVRVYAKLAEEKLQVLGELMRPTLWNIDMANTLGMSGVVGLLTENLNEELLAAKKIKAAAAPIFKEASAQPEEEKGPKSGKEKYSEKKSKEDERKVAPDLKKHAAR